MMIETKFDIGDEVRPGLLVNGITVSFNSYSDWEPKINYVLSDGYYRSEKELSCSEIGK